MPDYSARTQKFFESAKKDPAGAFQRAIFMCFFGFARVSTYHKAFVLRACKAKGSTKGKAHRLRGQARSLLFKRGKDHQKTGEDGKDRKNQEKTGKNRPEKRLAISNLLSAGIFTRFAMWQAGAALRICCQRERRMPGRAPGCSNMLSAGTPPAPLPALHLPFRSAFQNEGTRKRPCDAHARPLLVLARSCYTVGKGGDASTHDKSHM